MTPETHPPISSRTTLSDAVLRATIAAGKDLASRALSIDTLEFKKKDDPVTNLDKETELLIKAKIRETGETNFLGEEYGNEAHGLPCTIYIDPIDGTKSFVRGEFLSSVSIAGEFNGAIVAGCVYDFMRGILYAALNRDPPFMAYLHGRPAPLDHGPTAGSPTIDDVLRATMAAEGAWTIKAMPCFDPKLSKPCLVHNQGNKLVKRLQRITEIATHRQYGSVALVMAQTAAGCYDGIIMDPYEKDGKTDTADIAAGYYLMAQTGLIIRDRDGGIFDPHHPSNGIIAVKERLTDLILDQIEKEGARRPTKR